MNKNAEKTRIGRNILQGHQKMGNKLQKELREAGKYTTKRKCGKYPTRAPKNGK